MKRSLFNVLVPAVLLAALATGCSAAAEEDVSEDESAATDRRRGAPPTPHGVAIDGCEDMGAHRNADDCLRGANDDVLPTLGKNLTEARGGLGRAQSAMGGHRNVSTDFCNLAWKVMRLREGQAQSAYEKEDQNRARWNHSECARQRELSAGKLIDAYADLGVARRDLPDPRAEHQKCFQHFDRVPAQSPNEFTATTLARCIEDAARGTAAAYVQRATINHLYSAVPSVAEVTKSIDGAIASSITFCAMLADAGENRGKAGAKIDAAMCRADAAHDIYQSMVWISNIR